MRKSRGRRLGRFSERSRTLLRLRRRVTGQVKSPAHKGPLSRRRATRTLPPSATEVRGQPLRGVAAHLSDGLFQPRVWHLAKDQTPDGAVLAVPGDNGDRSGRITAHYLLITCARSADPGVCVRRRQSPDYSHSLLGDCRDSARLVGYNEI
ncbi:hypothetical protein Q8A67_022459 [Cirrhinus molitorella]|uniref:Uncharacterized protein n=1 Tax=Cirrhinus molitorella TaxID=172907 RepID=A0AA88P8V8_9TELE|nr:hypothetical protein Q8A67_022459 [Cirrhinus molitorella]